MSPHGGRIVIISKWTIFFNHLSSGLKSSLYDTALSTFESLYKDTLAESEFGSTDPGEGEVVWSTFVGCVGRASRSLGTHSPIIDPILVTLGKCKFV